MHAGLEFHSGQQCRQFALASMAVFGAFVWQCSSRGWVCMASHVMLCCRLGFCLHVFIPIGCRLLGSHRMLRFDMTSGSVLCRWSSPLIAAVSCPLPFRAIAQANITREYLHSLVQDGHKMPSGPVIISPHGLLPSLYRSGTDGKVVVGIETCCRSYLTARRTCSLVADPWVPHVL